MDTPGHDLCWDTSWRGFLASEGALLATPLGLRKSLVLRSQHTERKSDVLVSDGGPGASEQGFHPPETFTVCIAQILCSFFIGFIFSAVPKLWVSTVTPGCQLSTAAFQKY